MNIPYAYQFVDKQQTSCLDIFSLWSIFFQALGDCVWSVQSPIGEEEKNVH